MAGKLYFNTFGSDPYQTMQAKLTVRDYSGREAC